MQKPIGVFDSGVGGLYVLAKCVELLPNEKFVYLADKANMPYGGKPPSLITAASAACCDFLVGVGCKAVVVGCNTATENSIDVLRALYPEIPIVGLEPAIKPCVKDLSRGEYAVVLATPATCASKKFKSLVAQAGESVIPVPSPDLAELIERGGSDDALDKYLRKILAPYRDASAVVLGCSHYAYASGIIRGILGDGTKIYDGAYGAADRLRSVLLARSLAEGRDGAGGVKFFGTYKNADR